MLLNYAKKELEKVKQFLNLSESYFSLDFNLQNERIVYHNQDWICLVPFWAVW